MGNLTRRVLRELREGTPASEAAQVIWQKDGRGPAGNVAMMRCLPVALKWRRYPQRLVEETLLSAAITHYDPRCQWSAVAVNVALALALDGKSVELNMLAAALESAGAPDTVGEAVGVVEGCSLEDLDLDDPNAMGYALKAMQVGLWTLAQGETLQEALSLVVLAGGDTDTNAAGAGAVLGGIQGYEAIPASWLECVPGHDRLGQLADQLLMQDAINT
jgi:ADP-ribosyl-[dinitrogen reductase] hydrolase